jgi:hypothetical protein
LEAAEEVCSGDGIELVEVLNLLSHLVDKSLVIVMGDDKQTRYRRLETISEFAHMKLIEAAEAGRIQDMHLAYFCNLAQQAKPHIISSKQSIWLNSLEIELDNLRAALRWAQHSGSVEAGLQLMTNLEMFWFYKVHFHQTCLILEKLLAMARSSENFQVLARAHHTVGILYAFSGNLPAGYTHACESERLCLQLGPTGKEDLARARNLLIHTDPSVVNAPIRACAALRDNLELFQGTDDKWGIADAHADLAWALVRSGDSINARIEDEKALVLFQECGDNFRASQQIMASAINAFEDRKYAEASRRIEEVLSFYRQAPVNFAVDVPLWMLGVIAMRERDYKRAKYWYTECLLFEQQIGMYFQYFECFIGFAGIAKAEKRYERAAQLVGAAYADPLKNAFLLHFVEKEIQHLTVVLQEKLGDVNFEMFATKGRAMTLDQAVAFALEKIGV